MIREHMNDLILNQKEGPYSVKYCSGEITMNSAVASSLAYSEKGYH